MPLRILLSLKKRSPEEAPDSKRAAGSFEPAEGVKEVLINPPGLGGQEGEGRREADSQIGKRARRLPLRQQGHLRVEAIRYADHT